jgi:hypothetical protein
VGGVLDGHLAGPRLQRQRARHQLVLQAMAAKQAHGGQVGEGLEELCAVMDRLGQLDRGLHMLLPARVVASDAGHAAVPAFDLGSQGQIFARLGGRLSEQPIPAVVGDQVGQRGQGPGAGRSGGQVGDQRCSRARARGPLPAWVW